MLLNTASFKELGKSLAQVFATDEKTILSFFQRYAMEIVDENYGSMTINSLDLGLIMKFCNCSEIRCFDEVVIHHITPRENQYVLMTEDIMTLPNVLTKDTALSRYLKDKLFEFEITGDQVIARRNSYIIDWDKLYQSNISMRLGGRYSLRDFNVNGYLFITDFTLDHCRGWLGSPEILKSIANSYGEIGIADDYARKCKNYLLSFKVDLALVDVESTNTSIDIQKKSDLLVKYCINAMAYYIKRNKSNMDLYNPVIMLKRDYNVSHENIVQARNLIIDNTKVRVVDE